MIDITFWQLGPSGVSVSRCLWLSVVSESVSSLICRLTFVHSAYCCAYDSLASYWCACYIHCEWRPTFLLLCRIANWISVVLWTCNAFKWNYLWTIFPNASLFQVSLYFFKLYFESVFLCISLPSNAILDFVLSSLDIINSFVLFLFHLVIK